VKHDPISLASSVVGAFGEADAKFVVTAIQGLSRNLAQF
jgi:hypothetical protein